MDAVEKGFLIMVGTLALLLAALAIAATSVERRCLAAGYAHASFRIIGPSYCIKRVDQTDVVVPVDRVSP